MPYKVKIYCDFKYDEKSCGNVKGHTVPFGTAPSTQKAARAAETMAARDGWTKRRDGDGWICPACKVKRKATEREVNRAAAQFSKKVSASPQRALDTQA